MTSTTIDLAIIIDDNDGDAFLHRRLLQRAHFAREVLEFNYAEDALAFLKTANRPNVDLILVDINMPRMSGFEFADEFDKLYPELRPSTVVLMLSGSLDPADQQRAENHPAVNGYMTKPIGLASLQQYFETEMDGGG